MQEIHEKIAALSVEVFDAQVMVDNIILKRSELEATLKSNKESLCKVKNSTLVDLSIYRQMTENKNHSDRLLDTCKQAQATYLSVLKAKTKTLSLLKESYLSYDGQMSKSVNNIIQFRGQNGGRS
jgi:hypothetical protein